MNIDEMEALEQQATKGPWVIYNHETLPYGIHSKYVAIAGQGFSPEIREPVNIHIADARFIISSREFVPWAIKRIREFERVLDAGKRVVASYDNKNILFRNKQLAVSVPELEEEIRRLEKE